MQFSVIMPCHNAAAYVCRALRSVAAQTHLAHEIIVINDRSTDDSVRTIENSGVPVTLLHTDFGNAAAARNAGVERATGDWIAFLDADDYWLPCHLMQALDLLQGGSDVAYMAHRHVTYADSSEPEEVPVPYGVREPSAGLLAASFLPKFVSSGLAFYMSSVIVSRQRLCEVGAFDAEQVRRHDIDMWLRVIAGRTWAFHPYAATVYQLDTPGAISRQVASREYWFLRALLKNADAHGGETMTRLLRQISRRACVSALTDGDRQDWQRAQKLAWPSLSRVQRCAFSAISIAPGVFRVLNRWRRRRKFGTDLG